MYEMVTGKVPFDADTPVSVALKHMQEDPVPPIEENKNLPEAVNKIILKALKKDPMLRYQTATEMLQDLRMALKNPSGDFVEEVDYDETARTQKISTNMYENQRKANGKKENKFIAFIKTHPKLSIFLGIIILFFLAFGGTTLVLNVTNPKEVQLPNVVGLSQEEAKQKVEEAKLKFEVSSEEYNTEVEKGHVISQNPTYTEKYNVKEGSEIKVVISKGTEKTKVPKVAGMKEDEAIQALEDAKLKAEVVEETSKKVEEGYVISQETEANSEANAGDTVKIHVSTGTEKSTVPYIVGKKQDEAKKELEDAGLTVTITNAEDSSKETGVVLKQSLDSGKIVDKGSAITITVNSFEASKTISVSIDVKSITGGYTENSSVTNSANSTSNDNVVKTVSIEITSGGKTLWSDSGVDKNTTNKSASITGKGSMDVTLTIKDSNGMNKVRTQTVNFGSDTAISFK